MHDSQEFLRNLALVLGVAAVTTLIFQRLRQPVVFGYLLAGMIVGPHIPVPLVADEEMVRTLAELGVVLLMFALGLEFNLRKLAQVGPTAGFIAALQSSAMVGIGYLIGRAFGWTVLESVYAGAVIAISSTTIIVKAFAERGVTGKVTQIVFGVLIIEDLIAIFLLTVLTTVSAGGGVSAAELAATAGRLVAFLAALLVGGILIVPRLVRAVVRLDRPETTIVTAVAICFLGAWLAQAFGYSVALGAFIAGSLVAESGHDKTVEHLVQPVRDVFAAVFFVAVGMLIDPRLIAQHWPAVVVFTAAVIVGKVAMVSLGAFLTGYGTRTAVQTGMSLAQIGEFSFIIAGVGLASGATRDFLYPVAVAVSAVTTLTTPWLIGSAGRVASYVDRTLPRPLQTFVALYGSWMEGLRRPSGGRRPRRRERRLASILLLDGALIAATLFAVSRWLDATAAAIAPRTGLGPRAAAGAVLGLALLLLVPLAFGLVRSARALGLSLALRALPAPAKGKVDMAAAPRRALVVTWQLALLVLVTAPLVALLQPVLPPAATAALLVTALAGLGIAFWRSATNLQGHTRAGAEVIVAALARQMAGSRGAQPARPTEPAVLAQVRDLLPGLGEPASLRLGDTDFAVGRSLAELDLRDRTAASVLVIARGDQQVLLPTGSERLRAGDLLALTGTHDAVSAATRLLVSGAVD